MSTSHSQCARTEAKCNLSNAPSVRSSHTHSARPPSQVRPSHHIACSSLGPERPKPLRPSAQVRFRTPSCARRTQCLRPGQVRPSHSTERSSHTQCDPTRAHHTNSVLARKPSATLALQHVPLAHKVCLHISQVQTSHSKETQERPRPTPGSALIAHKLCSPTSPFRIQGHQVRLSHRNSVHRIQATCAYSTRKEIHQLRPSQTKVYISHCKCASKKNL